MLLLWVVVKNRLNNVVSLAHTKTTHFSCDLGGISVCLGIFTFVIADVQLSK